MSKMGTSFRKGRRAGRVLALSLVLAIVLAVAGVAINVSAWGSGSFVPQVAGTTDQDAIFDCSTSDVVSFKTNRIFWCDPSSWQSIQNVYGFRIVVGPGDSNSVKIHLDEGTQDDKRWGKPTETNLGTKVEYKSDSPISAGTFNDLMAMITLTFEPRKDTTKYGYAPVTITAYSSKTFTDGDENKWWDSSTQIRTWIDGKYRSTHSCTVAFYNYAKGRLDSAGAEMDYKMEYANYNQTYSQAVPDGAVKEDLPVNPENKNGGRVKFNIYLTDKGDGTSVSAGDTRKNLAENVAVGYQVKLKSETWTDKVTKYYKTNTGFTAYNPNGSNSDIRNYPLEEWELGDAFEVELEGLDAGEDYEIRGIIATDMKYDTPQYTSSLTFRYNRPNINSFNIGSTATVYKGGSSTMDITMLSTFNDTNAMNRTYDDNGRTEDGYIGVDGKVYKGPALQAQLYFTPDREFTTVTNDGKEIPQYDRSKWYKMPSNNAETVVKEMTDANGVVQNTFQNTWSLVKMPKTLYDITGNNADKAVAIDTKTAAFKLVLTDLYTGFSTVSYSDPFTVDSTPPSGMTISTAAVGDIPEKTDLDPEDGVTVGGSDANVYIRIGGATDGEGSGIKEYDYAMYYLPTGSAPKDAATTADVLAAMRDQGKGLKDVEYTDWSPAADAYERINGVINQASPIENMTEVMLSKDGYYRIDAKVVDNAGYESAEIKSAYFRVDRSLPSRPAVCLMKQESNGSLTAYDGRTYTDSIVWLFAYSEPQMGKFIQKFEYTTDGANWKEMAVAGQAGDAIHKIAADFNDDSKLDTVQPYSSPACTSTIDFKYQVGVNVTELKEDDYTSFRVRVTDTYGNISLLSSEAEMRTIAEPPTPTSVLSHQDIELALAVGNTTMETSTVTADIKNAAAQKINLAYYGAGAPEITALNGHICTWAGDSACLGACDLGDNCPYAKLAREKGYEYFTPEMVGVQGVSADPTDQSKFPWVRYEHTMYNYVTNTGKNNRVEQIPTVAYVDPNVNITNLGANPEHATFVKNGRTYYTAANSRIIWMGQTAPVTGNNLPTNADNPDPGNWANRTLLDWYLGASEYCVGGITGGNYDWYGDRVAPRIRYTESAWYKNNWNNKYYSCNGPDREGGFVRKTGEGTYAAEDQYTKAGHLYTELGAPSNGTSWGGSWDDQAVGARRIYRIIDMSVAPGDTVAEKVSGYVDLNLIDGKDGDDTGDMSVIAMYNGYFNSSIKDWLFLYEDQPTRKEISFSINDTYVCKHTSDWGGFFFNTTIRQSTTKTNSDKLFRYEDSQKKAYAAEPQWRISGYIFMVGVNGYTQARAPKGYDWRIVRMNDISMEDMADGVLVKGGDTAGTGTTWSTSLSFSYPNYDEDDFTLNLLPDGGKVLWSIANGNPITYTFPSGGSLETLAYSNQDVNASGIRHYKLVTEGNFTTVYVYNSGTAEKTNAQLAETWEKSSKAATYMTNGSKCASQDGYVAIRWDTSAKWPGSNYHFVVTSNGVRYGSDDATFKQLKAAGKTVMEQVTENGSTFMKEVSPGTVIYTPRPAVDNVRVGTYWARQAGVHTDTNCYGFGPATSCLSTTHAWGCLMDGRYVYTNVSMKKDVARTLAEVVNEPQWGGSSAKFIANISDDSTEDFANPILSSQVQWRLLKDKAKFIGWGGYDNEVPTLNFLKRIESEGTFISNVRDVEYHDPGTNEKPVREGENDTNKSNYDGNVVGTVVPKAQQIDEVADYITRQYYESLGYPIDENKAIGADTPVVELVKEKVAVVKDEDGNIISGKGTVFTLDEIANVSFSVTPEKYAISSANKDFPQGRWYIVRDINGFESSANPGEDGAITGSYSDALDLEITEPGRYTVYFAPDAKKIETNALNPNDDTCIFDFVVNTPPEARFSGYIDEGGYVRITDDSIDPDNSLQVSDGPTATTVDGVAISGVDQTQTMWRVALLDTKLNPTTLKNEVYFVSDTGWKPESPDGKSIENLTGSAAQSVGEGQVLTVYQKVTDYNARRVPVFATRAADGDVVGYRYEQLPGTTSTVLQQNLTSSAVATYAPLSAFKVSTVNTYDTAADSKQVEVTRSSKQTQGEPFTLSWAVDYDGTYRKLAWDRSTNNFYLCSQQWYDDQAALKKAQGDEYKEPRDLMFGANLDELKTEFGVDHPICAAMAPGGNPLAVLTFTGNSDPTQSERDLGEAECNDKWYITKGVISKLKGGAFGDTSKVVLQINETAYGISQVEALKPEGQREQSNIPNSSARAIYYRKDLKAPSLQTVTVRTLDMTSGEKVYSEYAASNYLDVTSGQKFIELTVNGSKDEQGSLAGYGYYFYTLEGSSEKDDGQYYKYDPATYALTPVANRLAALQKIGPGGGTITVGKTTMKNGDDVPTDSLNVAIFAFDNQTSGGKSPNNVVNLTNANETARTRIQEIKLSVSEPMPPAISVKNALSQNVAKIGNDNGFRGMDGSKDVQSSELNYYSNTAVTVEFTPRQAKYAQQADGTLVLAPNSPTTYFQDIYGAADLTGENNVRYTVKYKPTATGSWWTDADFESAGGSPYGSDGDIPNTTTLPFTDDGVYELTAQIVNGSGIVSASRTVGFTIDKTAPTDPIVRITYGEGQSYSSGTWVQSARMDISGSEDVNAHGSKYQISIDGGKTWSITPNGDITSDKTHYFTEDGEYTVLVRALDPAGNASAKMRLPDPTAAEGEAKYIPTAAPVIVRVDKTAPDTPGPTLTATSEETRILDNYLIRIGGFKPEEEGSVISVQDSVQNATDTQVVVPSNGSVRFVIKPAEGYKLGAIICLDVDEYQSVLPGQGTGDVTEKAQYDENTQCYYLDIDTVKSDKNLAVTFVPTTVENEAAYVSVARHVFSMRSAMAAVLAEEAPAETETQEPEGEKYSVSAHAEMGGGTAETALSEVEPGSTVVVKMKPYPHYKITDIKVNGTSIGADVTDNSDGTYSRTVTVNQDNTVIVVTFEKSEYRTVTVTTSDCGRVTLLGSGSSVEDKGNNVYEADVGALVYINSTPDTNYEVKSVRIDDVTYEGAEIPASFTVKPYEGDGEDAGVTVHVEFDAAATSIPRTFNVSVVPDEDGNTHGTISPSGTVKIPNGGSRTFTVTPENRYKIAEHTVTQKIGDELFINSPELTQVPGTNSYTFTVTAQSDGDITVVFEEKTYKFDPVVMEGHGSIGVQMASGDGLNYEHVPEGSDLVIIPTPDPGYMLRELVIIHGSSQYSVGAVTSYTLRGVTGNVTAQAHFVERKISHIETAHKITAVANNVKDANDALAEEPYQFKISDGVNESEPSAWSSRNDIEYTGILVKGATEEIPLEPNRLYYVSVQTRDRVGNLSGWQTSSVYTQANMPSLSGIESIDDNDPTFRSVSVAIDPNGNPGDTEYQVYYSLSPSMEPMSVANEDNGNGGWAKLTNGRFQVEKLEPGNRYYFKVVARNNVDHHNSSISEDTINIMLSPAAPGMNTLYFDEQSSPGGPVTLYWEPINGDVNEVQIYLDGRYLDQVDASLRQYTDTGNIMANAIGRYSYAYVNTAGAGSSCVAVSAEYHDAVYGGDEQKDKLDAMDQLKKDTGYEQMFNDTLTYPAFPTQVKSGSTNIRASSPVGENTGKIELRMNDDPGDNISRYQNYTLTLKAYKPILDSEGNNVLDAEGNPTYETEPVPIADWDVGKKYTNADGTQKPVESQIQRIGGVAGSWAVWEGLNPDYEYKVFVEEIRSTGPASQNNKLAGQEVGVEGTLGKVYTVDSNGYSFTYADDLGGKLVTKSGTWQEGELEKYTYDQPDGWDSPVTEGYIKFNKSPSVDLANEADVYTGNDPEKVKPGSDGKPYILIDQSMSDMTFHVNVAVWDTDGVREGSIPYVRGVISGVEGEAMPKLEAGSQFPTNETSAKELDNLYKVTFDASGLPTGVYDKMTIKAYDGDTETPLEVDIRLVVNRNTPQAKVTGGTKQQVEKGYAYNRSELLAVDTSVASSTAASTQLSKVALIVLPDASCDAVLGAHDYNTLYQKLCVNVDPGFMAKADALLKDDASNTKYKQGGKLTEDGLNLIITRVPTPVSYYVNISDTTYNSLIAADPNNSQKLRVEASKNGSTYWAELDFALTNGLCGWLNGDSNTLTPVAEVMEEASKNTYTMRMLANFGGNTSAQSVDYIVKNPPSATIQSEKAFGWTKTPSEVEFRAYEAMTMSEVIGKFQKGYSDVTPDYGDKVPEGTTGEALDAILENTSAAYEENGVWYVFKPTDKKATLGTDFVNGYLNIDLGVNAKFLKAGVMVSNVKEYDPVNNPGADPGAFAVDIKTGGEVTSNGVYNFNSAHLTGGETYYFWSYYTLPDGNTVYSMQYTAMTTTEDYQLGSFGFKEKYASYTEAGDETDPVRPKPIPIDITKMGHKDATGRLRITANYYAADQYGNFGPEGNGDMVELTGDQLAAAKKTLTFASDPESDSVVVTMSSSAPVYLTLNDTDDVEGHMILRLTLSVEENIPGKGYCEIREESEHVDIHVIDDESKITSYIIGLKDDAGILTELNDGTEHYYAYDFTGLPVNYTQMGTLTLTYVNDGEGDLEDITVEVYDDKALTTPSKNFEADPPSEKNLKKALDGEGTVNIRPVANLEDGVYEAWVVLTAEYVKPKDRVVVRIRQVVGQSTLTGRIYITNAVATDSDRTGQARILMYREEDVQTSPDPTVPGKLNMTVISGRQPVYETWSKEYGGEYTIPYILNKGSFGSSGKYYIVVERDGFVSFDSVAFNRINDTVASSPLMVLDTMSNTYQLDIHLRGGDVNQDQIIDDADLELLKQYYNRYVVEKGPDEPLTEEEAYIKRCDFNQDGVVNALDRAYLISNLGTTGRSYTYGRLNAVD